MCEEYAGEKSEETGRDHKDLITGHKTDHQLLDIAILQTPQGPRWGKVVAAVTA